MRMYNKQLSFSISPEDKAILRSAAKVAGVSMSQLIRESLEEYLEKNDVN